MMMLGNPFTGGKGGFSLIDLIGMGASPMGFMMAKKPEMGLAMLSPFGFALSRLFK